MAISPDGTHIAGGYDQVDRPMAAVFDAASTTRTYQTTGSSGPRLVSGTLAFSGDDLFALRGDGPGSAQFLWRLEGVTLPASGLTLAPPSGATALEPVTLTGQLTFPDGAAAGGQPIEVNRQWPEGFIETLGGVTTAADGTFSFTDTPTLAGMFSYGVIWDGSPTIRWTETSVSVSVARHETSLTMSGPATGNIKKELRFTGVLDLSGKPTTGPITVQRTIENRNGSTTTQLPTVRFAADGSFTVTDFPAVGGQYRYDLQYDGNN